MAESASAGASGVFGKKVLITGGLGFIGSNLALACLKGGADVTVYDNLDPNSGGNIQNISGFRDDLRLAFHDILNFEMLSAHIVEKDIVINCAASTSHPHSMREPWLSLDVNSRGVINLCEALRRFNPGARLVHLGTTTQLGLLRYQPADENHPEFPTDIYSANKSVSEKYALIYAHSHGINSVVGRLSNVFGPRASIHSPEFTFNNYFIGLALQGKDITVFGDGAQKRNVIYVDDVTEALLRLAVAEGVSGETFFVAGDDHYSVAGIAERTAAIIGGGVRRVPWPKYRRNIEFGDAVISNAKIVNALGWSPATGLDDGLASCADYFRPRLSHYLR
ncbi:MAG: NAD-dependent epimerase/dehydratase family protein [Candidatus Nitrospinota bacterium M3_3B_026]